MALTWKAEECIITVQPAAGMGPAVGSVPVRADLRLPLGGGGRSVNC